MAISKFENFDTRPGDETFRSAPIIERIDDFKKNKSIEDMMSNINTDKRKMKNTSVLDMAGVLQKVEYFHQVPNTDFNYLVNADGPNNLAMEDRRYERILNFEVKFTDAQSIEDENYEMTKSYTASGSLIILPRTIKPYENDFFKLDYYGRSITYRIISVEAKTFEDDSGFECRYAMWKAEADICKEENIIRTVHFVREFMSGSYRTILLDNELENLKKFFSLYDQLSSIYNSLFYDSKINSYLCPYGTKTLTVSHGNKNNSIYPGSTVNGGPLINTTTPLFRATVDWDPYNNLNPIQRSDNVLYDNFLNKFIEKNHIFRSYDGLMISSEALLHVDKLDYKRSIFGCMETQTVANLVNTILSPVKIEACQPGVSAYFVGKHNVLHLPDDGMTKVDIPLLPENLMTNIINGSTLDLTTPCSQKVYGGVEKVISETIVRYIWEKKSVNDFAERFLYLFDHIEELYVTDKVLFQAYYMFPLLGFVVEREIDKLYKSNTVVR